MSSAALRTVLTITGGVLFGWSARQIVRRQLEEELRRDMTVRESDVNRVLRQDEDMKKEIFRLKKELADARRLCDDLRKSCQRSAITERELRDQLKEALARVDKLKDEVERALAAAAAANTPSPAYRRSFLGFNG